jgi:hypothetical protein
MDDTCRVRLVCGCLFCVFLNVFVRACLAECVCSAATVNIGGWALGLRNKPNEDKNGI